MAGWQGGLGIMYENIRLHEEVDVCMHGRWTFACVAGGSLHAWQVDVSMPARRKFACMTESEAPLVCCPAIERVHLSGNPPEWGVGQRMSHPMLRKVCVAPIMD
eukprot:364040-Chlamydomonas_euryale.AAC.2